MPNCLAVRLRAERERRGVTQEDVARDLGLGSRVVVSRYESGTRVPDAATLTSLAEYYGVAVDYLLGRINDRRLTTTADFGPGHSEFVKHQIPEKIYDTIARGSQRIPPDKVDQFAAVIDKIIEAFIEDNDNGSDSAKPNPPSEGHTKKS